ncbi:hypothetical protein CC79DRAFT_907569 [Sarocladium strictum]
MSAIRTLAAAVLQKKKLRASPAMKQFPIIHVSHLQGSINRAYLLASSLHLLPASRIPVFALLLPAASFHISTPWLLLLGIDFGLGTKHSKRRT